MTAKYADGYRRIMAALGIGALHRANMTVLIRRVVIALVSSGSMTPTPFLPNPIVSRAWLAVRGCTGRFCQHFVDVFTIGKADAALAASVFHFDEITIKRLKEELKRNKIDVRL